MIPAPVDKEGANQGIRERKVASSPILQGTEFIRPTGMAGFAGPADRSQVCTSLASAGKFS